MCITSSVCMVHVTVEQSLACCSAVLALPGWAPLHRCSSAPPIRYLGTNNTTCLLLACRMTCKRSAPGPLEQTWTTTSECQHSCQAIPASTTCHCPSCPHKLLSVGGFYYSLVCSLSQGTTIEKSAATAAPHVAQTQHAYNSHCYPPLLLTCSWHGYFTGPTDFSGIARVIAYKGFKVGQAQVLLTRHWPCIAACVKDDINWHRADCSSTQHHA
jgi:hypothetical protein